MLGLDDATAAKLMTAAMGSSADVSAAAHLPAPIAARIAGITAAGGAVTAFRLEGVAPSVVASQSDCWRELAAPLSAAWARCEEAASRALWRAIRDVAPFAASGPAGERYRLAHFDGAIARRRGRPRACREAQRPRSSMIGPAG